MKAIVEILLCEVQNCEHRTFISNSPAFVLGFLQIFPPTEKIENINDQYWTLRAEEVSIVVVNINIIAASLTHSPCPPPVVSLFQASELLHFSVLAYAGLANYHY